MGSFPLGLGSSRPRGVRRETGAGMPASRKTMPIRTAGKGDSPHSGEKSCGLAIAPVSEKRGGKHPFRCALGSVKLHSSLWAWVEAAVAPRKRPPPRVEGRVDRSIGSGGGGSMPPRGKVRGNFEFLKTAV